MRLRCRRSRSGLRRGPGGLSSRRSSRTGEPHLRLAIPLCLGDGQPRATSRRRGFSFFLATFCVPSAAKEREAVRRPSLSVAFVRSARQREGKCLLLFFFAGGCRKPGGGGLRARYDGLRAAATKRHSTIAGHRVAAQGNVMIATSDWQAVPYRDSCGNCLTEFVLSFQWPVWR